MWSLISSSRLVLVRSNVCPPFCLSVRPSICWDGSVRSTCNTGSQHCRTSQINQFPSGVPVFEKYILLDSRAVSSLVGNGGDRSGCLWATQERLTIRIPPIGYSCPICNTAMTNGPFLVAKHRSNKGLLGTLPIQGPPVSSASRANRCNPPLGFQAAHFPFFQEPNAPF
jgi:hypothetical protein